MHANVIPFHIPERRTFTRPTKIWFDHRTRSYIGVDKRRCISHGSAVDVESVTLWTDEG